MSRIAEFAILPCVIPTRLCETYELQRYGCICTDDNLLNLWAEALDSFPTYWLLGSSCHGVIQI